MNDAVLVIAYVYQQVTAGVVDKQSLSCFEVNSNIESGSF
jgi:hypothetical protein